MGHRLTKIYTRTGDDGSTGLAANALETAIDHWNASLPPLKNSSCPAAAAAVRYAISPAPCAAAPNGG